MMSSESTKTCLHFSCQCAVLLCYSMCGVGLKERLA
jgi:hypothetical protein